MGFYLEELMTTSADAAKNTPVAITRPKGSSPEPGDSALAGPCYSEVSTPPRGGTAAPACSSPLLEDDSSPRKHERKDGPRSGATSVASSNVEHSSSPSACARFSPWDRASPEGPVRVGRFLLTIEDD
mmetsp:Transcript_34064/g.60227  ORF Transcript_34064/g.60227 Transcript_34064/m.60227 type:complete len:128 (-) Transcript_34064:33-416(-)